MADVKPLAGRKRAPAKAVIPEANGRGTFKATETVPRCARHDLDA